MKNIMVKSLKELVEEYGLLADGGWSCEHLNDNELSDSLLASLELSIKGMEL